MAKMRRNLRIIYALGWTHYFIYCDCCLVWWREHLDNTLIIHARCTIHYAGTVLARGADDLLRRRKRLLLWAAKRRSFVDPQQATVIMFTTQNQCIQKSNVHCACATTKVARIPGIASAVRPFIPTHNNNCFISCFDVHFKCTIITSHMLRACARAVVHVMHTTERTRIVWRMGK